MVTKVIHELRTYTVPDGRMPEVMSLFNEVLFAVFARSNIKVVSFGTKRDSSTLVYMCEFDSEAAKVEAWKAFFSDPEWVAAWQERSDPKDPMVTEVLSEVVDPVPFPS
jgi:hypothetical protein